MDRWQSRRSCYRNSSLFNGYTAEEWFYYLRSLGLCQLCNGGVLGNPSWIFGLLYRMSLSLLYFGRSFVYINMSFLRLTLEACCRMWSRSTA